MWPTKYLFYKNNLVNKIKKTILCNFLGEKKKGRSSWSSTQTRKEITKVSDEKTHEKLLRNQQEAK